MLGQDIEFSRKTKPYELFDQDEEDLSRSLQKLLVRVNRGCGRGERVSVKMMAIEINQDCGKLVIGSCDPM